MEHEKGPVVPGSSIPKEIRFEISATAAKLAVKSNSNVTYFFPGEEPTVENAKRMTPPIAEFYLAFYEVRQALVRNRNLILHLESSRGEHLA